MSAPIIILVEPQMGENIGASARVMANFGLSELRIVNPRDGWRGTVCYDKAYAMAAGAAELVEAAGLFDTLADAVADCQQVYATTPRAHVVAKPRMNARKAVQSMAGDGMKSAILFGCERSGLTNEHISLADALIEIPTAEYSSLNLAQAVAVCAYEWQMAQADAVQPQAQSERATKAEMVGFFEHLEGELDAAGFYKTEGLKAHMQKNMRALFTRCQPSEQEVHTLRGMVRSLRR